MLWRYLAAVALFTLSTGITRPMFALFAASLGVSAVLIGVIASAGIAANALTRPVSGRLSDRYGRRRFLLGGLILLAAATGVYALTPRSGAPLILGAATVAVGVGAAAFWPSLKASLVEQYSSQRERALGYITATQGACTALGAAAGGAVAAALGFRWAFAAGAGVLLAAAVLLAPMTPAPAPDITARKEQPQKDPAPSPVASPSRRLPVGVLALGGMIAVVNLGLGAILSFLALYAARIYGSSTAVIGLLFTAVFLGQAAGGLAIGRLTGTVVLRGVGRRLTLAFTLAVSAGICLAAPLLGFALFALTQTVLAVLATVAIIVMTAMTTELLPAGALGAAIGTVEAVGFAAALLGPVLGGIVFVAAPAALFPAVGALFAAALLLLVAARSTIEQNRAEESVLGAASPMP